MQRHGMMRALRTSSPVLVAVLAASALAGQGIAQPRPDPPASKRRWFQERSAELPGASRLAVRSRGDVTLVGTASKGIRYHVKLWARTGADAADFVPAMFGGAGIKSDRRPDGTAELGLRLPECAGCRVVVRLEIEVPEGISEIDIQTIGGDIEIRGVAGSVKALAANGSVTMDAIGADVSVTAGGRVMLGAIGGSVTCETAGGGIDLVSAGGPARLLTNVGSVRAKSVEGDLDARTRAGSIEIGRVAGTARVATSSGSIQVIEAFNGVRAQVGAGDIRIGRASGVLNVSSGTGNIAVGLDERAGLHDSVLTTGVGSVVIFLPETIALTVEAAVRMFRGRQSIVSDFPSIQVLRSPGLFGTAEAVGSINGGGGTLRSGTGIGRIEIRRQR